MKEFTSGCYPGCAERWENAYKVCNGFADSYVNYVISYYGLNKFLIFVYGQDSLYSSMYIYLKSHDYISIYDDGVYAYFISQ